MTKPPLTIIILTFNEAHNIPALAIQVKELGFPCFVVDSYSTDNTITLLKDNNLDFVQHPFENYSKQRNWAQQNNPNNTEWVLHVDADERFCPELITWLKTQFNPSDAQADGYMFGRRAIFMNQWIKSHYNYHLRLFRTSKGRCEEKAYDQHFIVEGAKVIVKHADMESSVCDNLNQFIQAHNKWARLEAIDILKKTAEGDVKSSLTGSPIERTRWLKNNVFQKMPLFVRSFLYFFYRYVIRLGFLDGTKGFIFHVLQAFWFRFLVDAKVYELKKIMDDKKVKLEEAIDIYK